MYLIGRNLLITESFGSNTCKYKGQCEKKKNKKKKKVSVTNWVNNFNPYEVQGN